VNRQAFHDFYRETASGVRAYLRLSCKSASLADDLVQETYLRMLRQPLPALGAEQLRAYLYKTAHSVLVDHYRAARRETQWKAEHDTPTAIDGAELDHALERADDCVDSLELPFDMRQVLASLNAKQRTLLWLAYVEGFKHHEIAEVVGVKTGSVKVLLSRARAELAAKLDERRGAQSVGRRVTR
jgi:RNA polymerase sigma-70 factor (ECF subfamily)